MARRQFQHAGSRQHSVGICAGKPVGYAGVHGVPESALSSFSVMGWKVPESALASFSVMGWLLGHFWPHFLALVS